MTDPLIGLSFDPAAVRFEEWRDSATTRKELGPMPKWIFGCALVDGGRVCVIAGHRSIRPEGGGAAVTEPDFGGVIEERGAVHKVLGVPDRMFDKQAIVSPAVRDSLLRDSVSRYIKAFGDASKLRAAISAQRVPLDTIPRPLLEALRTAGVLQAHLSEAERRAAIMRASLGCITMALGRG